MKDCHGCGKLLEDPKKLHDCRCCLYCALPLYIERGETDKICLRCQADPCWFE